MKTRSNAGAQKPSTAKKTPPAARKSASKAQPSPSPVAVATPKAVEAKRTTPSRAANQVKKNETTPATASKRRQSSVDESAGGAGVGTTSVVRRTSARNKTPVSANVSTLKQSAKAKGNASKKGGKVDIKDVEVEKEDHVDEEVSGERVDMEEIVSGGEKPAVEEVGVSVSDEKGAVEVEEDEEDPVEMEETVVEEVAKSSENVPTCDEEDPVETGTYVVEEVAMTSENVRSCDAEDPVEMLESLVEVVAKSSEHEPPCDVQRFVVEEVPRSSENDPSCDEEVPIEIKEYVAEEVPRSSENELPCDEKDPIEIKDYVVEDVVRSSQNELPCDENDPIEMEESVVEEVAKSTENEPPCDVRQGVEVKGELEEELKDNDSKEEISIDPPNMVHNNQADLQGEYTESAKEVYDVDEEMVDYGEKIDLGERGEEELLGDDAEDHDEGTVTLEDERKQLTAIVKERKIKKEREVFISGLDPDVVEEDVRGVLERIGGIVDIRLQKNSSTNKNKGYAFVEFKDKEHVRRALSDMKNLVIRGKRCVIEPSEDNDTLFIGNISTMWTKEAIQQKLKDYEVEGVENINLVPDIKHEGLSRGFAFVEFSCHGDALLAYKRLQQPDVIFGHPERTAKVGFAEPVREPDPAVMAQVKSIFVDGLPPHWDEKHVRERFKSYGDILRVVLARNMCTAKRKDYGFVDFSSHESAVACVNSINNTPLDEGTLKIKVKARLSNPLPKTQAVKGGVRGGYRIGCGGSGVPRSGRDFGRSGHLETRQNFQRDRPFYDGGRGQTGGISASFRGGHLSSGGSSAVASPSSRPYTDRSWYGASDRGRGVAAPFRRHPHSPDAYVDGPQMRGHFDRPPMRASFDGPHMRGHFDRPPMRVPFDGPHMRGHFVDGPYMRGRTDGPHMRGHFDGPHMRSHFDEPYYYDECDRAQGMKRPLHMRDYEPDFMEPNRHRPRLNSTEPTASFRRNQYSDTSGAGRSLNPHDYNGPESHYGSHSSYYRGNHSYGRGRY